MSARTPYRRLWLAALATLRAVVGTIGKVALTRTALAPALPAAPTRHQHRRAAKAVTVLVSRRMCMMGSPPSR